MITLCDSAITGVSGFTFVPDVLRMHTLCDLRSLAMYCAWIEKMGNRFRILRITVLNGFHQGKVIYRKIILMPQDIKVVKNTKRRP